jgi:DNA polymerase delta subunit 1
MVEFPCDGMSQEEAIKHSWKLGEEAAEICNDMFKKPNDLELEKVYCPYILYSKKRYAAKMWTQNKAGEMEMEKIDVKGLQLVRRDNTPYTRDVSKEVLDKILESNDPEPAITLAMVRARELLNGQVTINRLIMSKSLSDEYKTKPHCRECLSPMDEGCGCNKGFMDKWKYSRMMNEEPQPIPAQPHVHVIEKMNARNPGSHPHTGDRVPFVLVKTEDPKAKMFERAEDPKYVEENELELDYMYYFTNQLKKPIEDLLDPLIAGRDIFRDFIPPKPLRKKPVPKCKNIMDMFKDYEQKNSKS